MALDDARTDLELLRAWKANDRDAGNLLVRRHFDAVYRFLSGKTRGNVTDLVQRTFLGCVEALDRMPPDVRFKAFLFGIARNQLLMQLRKQHRRARVEVDDPQSGVAWGPTVSGAVALREEQSLLLVAMKNLSFDHLETLQLYYWEELSVAEIASVQGVRPGTIKSKLFRARKRLEEEIQKVAKRPGMAEQTIGSLEVSMRSLSGCFTPPG